MGRRLVSLLGQDRPLNIVLITKGTDDLVLGVEQDEVGVLGDALKDQGMGALSGLEVEPDDAATRVGLHGGQLGIFQVFTQGPAKVGRLGQGGFLVGAGKNDGI